MTTFENGPAQGQTLELRRSPRFLRVCRSPDLKFDALDQVDDQAKPEEALIPYEIVGKPTHGFVRRSGGGGGAVSFATYRWIPDGPDDATMRDNDRWRAWCVERAKANP